MCIITAVFRWVGRMSAAGGGDPPDAVADGLYEALNLEYRQRATKICIWIGKFMSSQTL